MSKLGTVAHQSLSFELASKMVAYFCINMFSKNTYKPNYGLKLCKLTYSSKKFCFHHYFHFCNKNALNIIVSSQALVHVLRYIIKKHNSILCTDQFTSFWAGILTNEKNHILLEIKRSKNRIESDIIDGVLIWYNLPYSIVLFLFFDVLG